jgi:hypothetical protein
MGREAAALEVEEEEEEEGCEKPLAGLESHFRNDRSFFVTNPTLFDFFGVFFGGAIFFLWYNQTRLNVRKWTNKKTATTTIPKAIFGQHALRFSCFSYFYSGVAVRSSTGPDREKWKECENRKDWKEHTKDGKRIRKQHQESNRRYERYPELCQQQQQH